VLGVEVRREGDVDIGVLFAERGDELLVGGDVLGAPTPERQVGLRERRRQERGGDHEGESAKAARHAGPPPRGARRDRPPDAERRARPLRRSDGQVYLLCTSWVNDTPPARRSGPSWPTLEGVKIAMVLHSGVGGSGVVATEL